MVFNAYLQGEEREAAIAEATLDNEYEKLCTLYEMTMLQHAQMERDAELKVFAESGTYDDLTYLLEQAEQQTEEKKKGIITKIIDVIKSICNAISNTVKKILGLGNKDEEVEISKDTVEKANAFVKMKEQVVAGVNELKRSDATMAEKLKAGGSILSAIKVPILATAAAAGGAVVMVKMKKGDLDNLSQKVDDCNNTIKGQLAALEQKINESGNPVFMEGLKKIKSVVSLGNSVTKEIVNAISKATNTVVDGAKAIGADVKDKVEQISSKEQKKIGKVADKAKKELDEGIKNAGKAVINAKKEAKTVKVGKNIYKCMADGSCFVNLGNKGNQANQFVKADMKKLPQKVVDVLQQIASNPGKFGAYEQADFDMIYEILGDEYTIEMAEDGESILISESVVLDKMTSIFGVDYTDEFTESEDLTLESEISELMELFDSL